MKTSKIVNLAQVTVLHCKHVFTVRKKTTSAETPHGTVQLLQVCYA